jgi:hypothetical protein
MSAPHKAPAYAEAQLNQAIDSYGIVADRWRQVSGILQATGIIDRTAQMGLSHHATEQSNFHLIVARSREANSTGHIRETSRTMRVSIRTGPPLPIGLSLVHPERHSESLWGVRVRARLSDSEAAISFGWRRQEQLRSAGKTMLLAIMQAPGDAGPEDLYKRHLQHHKAFPSAHDIESASTAIRFHAEQGLGLLAQVTTAFGTETFNPTESDGPDYLIAAQGLAVLVNTAIESNATTTPGFQDISVLPGLLNPE